MLIRPEKPTAFGGEGYSSRPNDSMQWAALRATANAEC